MKARFDAELAVHPPYRLDLTVEALRRLAANVVDRVGPYGYRRCFDDQRGRHIATVVQVDAARLRVRIDGANGERRLTDVERMLGTRVRIRGWLTAAKQHPWLYELARTFRGLHPPRYPTVWEACAHAIVFQQISIHAAGAIMQRLVEATSTPVDVDGEDCRPFPAPRALLMRSAGELRAVGLSTQKVAHLQSAADAIENGAVRREELEMLPSEEASQRLQAIRGIGPWSAAVVLLRGLGRLDVFPRGDSGVARSLAALSGDRSIDADALLASLGSVRGMLYYHLLLGRRRERGAAWGIL